MCTKLTHEQAIALRNVSILQWGYVVECDKALDGLWTVFISVETQRVGRTMTATGHQALAAYDAEWVTVRRTDAQAIIDTDDSGDCGRMLEDVAARFRDALEGKP